MNTGAPWPTPAEAEARVLRIQTKLHQWASGDHDRRFDDLFNLVADPSFLLVAWRRVRGNKGAGTAGVDGQTAYSIETGRGVDAFLSDLRAELKAQRFIPLPVRERMIPKPGSAKRRRLGIPVVRDRVVQASLKLVLEPIWEADFAPCSYGFRPNRRAHDAVAEIRLLAANSYEWAVEGDIEACFDEIDHAALLDRVRRRVGDKRVLALVKAFLKAGIMTEAGQHSETTSGTPQGGILSPLLANVALSVLDEHVVGVWQDRVARAKRRRHGLPNYRLVRYADDFVIMVSGTREHAEALVEEAADVLAVVGLRLSPTKTKISHIDQGLDLLGWRIQRHRKRGAQRRYIYTYPAKKALRAVTGKVKALCWQDTNLPLSAVLHQLNMLLRGWTTYFRPGVSHATFEYLRGFVWRQVLGWLRRKHRRSTWKQLRRRYCPDGWWPAEGQVTLFNPAAVRTTRYRYRGAAIPAPWTTATAA